MRWIARSMIVFLVALAGCQEKPSDAAAPSESPRAQQTEQSEVEAILEQWPPVELPSVFELGDVARDETVERTAEMKNVGDEAVRIVAVRSNCTCTVPQAELEGTVIAPGETFSLPFQFGGEGRTGRRSAEIRIFFADYEQPLLMRLRANVTLPPRR